MTNDRPHLFLNRLVVVTHSGAIAFDELFHRGVNIIRGQNSSGKSTISNFIFYVFGGDYNNWTSEALRCRDVIAEVEINGAVITLKRHISEGGLQPMSIFWNSYEQSKNDSINWQTFPYKQTANTASFTNVIFNALTFPEVKSETDSNITIHQIFRLLYIDQDTPTQSLFRFERFDLPLTRQAISEVLLGVYDDTLYGQRLAYRNSLKENDEKKKQFESINRVFGQSGAATNIQSVQKEIELAQTELKNIDTSILDLRQQNVVRTTTRTAVNSEKIQAELIPVKNRISITKTKINQYEIEISDSKQFIATLEKRVDELNNSLLTRKILGELPLTHCPQCLSPLENQVEEGHCFLCKQPLEEEAEKANAKRLKQEMELQIKESKSLLEEKERTFVDLIGELPVYEQKARVLQKQLDTSIEASQTTRDERIDGLLISKGGVEKKIEYLTQQIKAVEMLELLKKELAELAALTERLKLEINQKEEQQKKKLQTALQKIREYTLYILRNDLDRQEEFRAGKIIDVNFQKDTYSLDGGNNFSASSKIYFKNAVLFSIFFASLELDFFRYPRFILCDNMEDKGMEKVRTQNFQNLITSMSERFDKDNQIIFTTSMIADELNDTPYCVGENYDRNNKTLKV
jgi:coenzyme F420-reducing hydrogenase delta subunit